MSAVAASYEDRVRAWSSTPRWRAEASAFLDLLALPAGAEVLDVGTGAGALLPLLRERGHVPTGVDRWDGWRRCAGPAPSARADAHRLPFRDGAFDAVVLHHVLAHLADAAAATAEARRVLRRGGRLGIATPNALFVRATALPARLSGHVADPTVVRHHSRASLRRLAASAGLAVVAEGTWGKLPLLLPLPAARERLFLVAEVP